MTGRCKLSDVITRLANPLLFRWVLHFFCATSRQSLPSYNFDKPTLSALYPSPETSSLEEPDTLIILVLLL